MIETYWVALAEQVAEVFTRLLSRLSPWLLKMQPDRQVTVYCRHGKGDMSQCTAGILERGRFEHARRQRVGEEGAGVGETRGGWVTVSCTHAEARRQAGAQARSIARQTAALLNILLQTHAWRTSSNKPVLCALTGAAMLLVIW